MNQLNRIIQAVFILILAYISMYLVFFTEHELIGLLGFAVLFCIFLFFKFKTNSKWRKA